MMLTAAVYPPISVSGNAAIYDNLFDYQTDSYSHSSNTTMGYDSMSIQIAVHEPEMRDWLTNGLGRHIEVLGPGGIVWEGFVNDITLTSGPTKITVGPLLDIANRVKVSYTTKSYNTNPPIGGQPAETPFEDNTASQARWGTFEEVVSGGEGTSATMLSIRSANLADMAFPKMSQDLAPGSESPNSISLSCLGYYHYLDRYYYADAVTTGFVDITTKMASVLDADPNSLFDTQNLATNLLDVPAVEDGTRSAMTIIKELVGYGFTSYRRALFWVGRDRLITYRAIELDQAPKYVYNPYDQYPSLSLPDGTPVKPWDVVPGEWIEIESLSAKPLDDTLVRDSDPRFMFIESVTYTAPLRLQIGGGKGLTLKEKIDQLGLGLR